MEDKTKNEGQVVYLETAITVADGLQTVYTATVGAHVSVALALGEAQLFSHQGETLRMCGCRVEGTFGGDLQELTGKISQKQASHRKRRTHLFFY